MAALDRTMREEQRRPGRGERFATVCSVHVDHQAGLLRIVLAGHHPPLLLTDGQVRPVLGPASPPLGISWLGTREIVEVPIPAGEWSLFLYTDGLIEGRAAPGSSERFGADRLAALDRRARAHRAHRRRPRLPAGRDPRGQRRPARPTTSSPSASPRSRRRWPAWPRPSGAPATMCRPSRRASALRRPRMAQTANRATSPTAAA